MQFIIFTAIHGGWMDGGVPPIEREKLTWPAPYPLTRGIEKSDSASALGDLFYLNERSTPDDGPSVIMEIPGNLLCVFTLVLAFVFPLFTESEVNNGSST